MGAVYCELSSTSWVVAVCFFSRRRRQTRGAFVTGVQTCARPICGGSHPGGAAEDAACGQPGAARIVEIEQAADELSGGEKAGHRREVGVEHLRGLGIDPQAAAGEGDAADRKSVV